MYYSNNHNKYFLKLCLWCKCQRVSENFYQMSRKTSSLYSWLVYKQTKKWKKSCLLSGIFPIYICYFTSSLEIICSHSLVIYWNIQNRWDRNAGLTYSNLSWWSVCGIVCSLKTGSGWLSNLSLLFDSCLILPLDKLKKSQSFVDC